MATAKKEVTYRVLDKKNFVGFMHPKTKKFITANENNEFVVSEDDKEAIEILERNDALWLMKKKKKSLRKFN